MRLSLPSGTLPAGVALELRADGVHDRYETDVHEEIYRVRVGTDQETPHECPMSMYFWNVWWHRLKPERASIVVAVRNHWRQCRDFAGGVVIQRETLAKKAGLSVPTVDRYIERWFDRDHYCGDTWDVFRTYLPLIDKDPHSSRSGRPSWWIIPSPIDILDPDEHQEFGREVSGILSQRRLFTGASLQPVKAVKGQVQTHQSEEFSSQQREQVPTRARRTLQQNPQRRYLE